MPRRSSTSKQAATDDTELSNDRNSETTRSTRSQARRNSGADIIAEEPDVELPTRSRGRKRNPSVSKSKKSDENKASVEEKVSEAFEEKNEKVQESVDTNSGQVKSIIEVPNKDEVKESKSETSDDKQEHKEVSSSFETKLAENESSKLEPEPKGPIVEAPEQVKNEQESDQRDMRSPVNVLAVEDDKHSEGAIGKKVEEGNEEKRIEPPLLEVALPKKPEVNEEVSVQPSSISSQEAVALPKKPAVTDNINETKEAIDKSTINPTQDSSKQPAAETSPTSVNSKSADNYIRNKSRSRSRSGNRNDSHEPRKSNENRSWNRVSRTDARPNGDRLSPYNNRLKKDDSKFYLETKTNTWVFTRTDIYEHTPGVLDGIDPKQEMVQRAKGINFMVTVGSQLRVPQMTINAACTFFHRFYMRFSIKKFHYYDIGGTCLFLATKVEESHRRLREVIIACTRVASKDLKMVVDEQSKDFWRWRDAILLYEELLLEALCFDLNLESPYQILSGLVEKYDLKKEAGFCRSAWSFVNDSCRTVLPILYSTKLISAAGFFLGIKSCQNRAQGPVVGKNGVEEISAD